MQSSVFLGLSVLLVVARPRPTGNTFETFATLTAKSNRKRIPVKIPFQPGRPSYEHLPTIRRYNDGTTEYNLLIVTDLDKASRVGEWTWRAVTRKGRLKLIPHMSHVSITWDENSDRNLTSSMNVGGRAMELSDLTTFHDRILTVDDKTGMISEIKDNKIIPWVFLNSGSGNTSDPFKCEWMTIKDDKLHVGSVGNEYRDKDGKLDRNTMWIKTVTPDGKVTNINWIEVYDKIRKSVGISEPGYLLHEAVQWSSEHGRWYFLPRKESKTAYMELDDEKKGTNLLIIGDVDLRRFTTIRIGPREPTRGFSAFAFIPGTGENIIVALKTEEVTGRPFATYVTVFTTYGQILLKDEKLAGNYKFEGLYFI